MTTPLRDESYIHGSAWDLKFILYLMHQDGRFIKYPNVKFVKVRLTTLLAMTAESASAMNASAEVHDAYVSMSIRMIHHSQHALIQRAFVQIINNILQLLMIVQFGQSLWH